MKHPIVMIFGTKKQFRVLEVMLFDVFDIFHCTNQGFSNKSWYSIDFGSSPTSHAYYILSLTKTYVTRLNAVKSTDIFSLTPFILYKSNIILTATNSQQQVLLQQFFGRKKLIHEFSTEAEVVND